MATALTVKTPIRDLENGKQLWQTFHGKQHRSVTKVDVKWPKKWYRVGHISHIYYSSDKWYDNGYFVDYYHEHGPKINLWFNSAGKSADDYMYCLYCGTLVEYMKDDVLYPCKHRLADDTYAKRKTEKMISGIPPVDFPTTGVVLGEFIGFNTDSSCYGESRDDLLCASSSGDFLFVVGSDNVPWAIIEGPSLRVTSAGIVG